MFQRAKVGTKKETVHLICPVWHKTRHHHHQHHPHLLLDTSWPLKLCHGSHHWTNVRTRCPATSRFFKDGCTNASTQWAQARTALIAQAQVTAWFEDITIRNGADIGLCWWRTTSFTTNTRTTRHPKTSSCLRISLWLRVPITKMALCSTTKWNKWRTSFTQKPTKIAENGAIVWMSCEPSCKAIWFARCLRHFLLHRHVTSWTAQQTKNETTVCWRPRQCQATSI